MAQLILPQDRISNTPESLCTDSTENQISWGKNKLLPPWMITHDLWNCKSVKLKNDQQIYITEFKHNYCLVQQFSMYINMLNTQNYQNRWKRQSCMFNERVVMQCHRWLHFCCEQLHYRHSTMTPLFTVMSMSHVSSYITALLFLLIRHSWVKWGEGIDLPTLRIKFQLHWSCKHNIRNTMLHTNRAT